MTDATAKATSTEVGSIEESVKDNKRDAAKQSEQTAAKELADEDDDDEEDEDFVSFSPPILLWMR